MEKPEYYDKDIFDVKFDEDFVEFKREWKIKLPVGKTTPKGKYPKFKKDEECAFPERADCNSDFFYRKCPYMEFVSLGNWKCNFIKK